MTLAIQNAKNCRSAVIPSLRYRNALPAIDWLVHALGFQKHAVHLAPDNTTVTHAELTFGNGMIMLGSVPKDGDQSASGRSMVQPDEISLHETHGICLIVGDADHVYANAKAAGAAIVMEIADMPYGGRAFTCRDPEGHSWHIGTYDPWASPQTAVEKSKADSVSR